MIHNLARPDELFPSADQILNRAYGSSHWFTDYIGRELDFVKDVLGAETEDGNLALWEAQRYTLEALFEHKFVSVSSCRKSGKSHGFGFEIPAFFCTAPSRIIVTGPTMRQIQNVPWGNARSQFFSAREQLPGRMMSTEWRIDDLHYAICIPSKEPEHLRGYHAGVRVPNDPDLTDAEYDALVEVQKRIIETEAEKAEAEGVRLLVAIDEPEAIPAETFRVLNGMFNADNVYCLMKGNPTLGIDEDHEYPTSIRERSEHIEAGDLERGRWHTIKISAFSEEEFPDPLHYDKVFDRVPPYLRKRAELEDAKARYPASDPIFMADYLGQAPRGETSNLVCPRSALESGVRKWVNNQRPLGPRIGVDIGTGGSDPCVAVLYMNGRKLASHRWFPDRDDREGQVSSASTIQALALRWGEELAVLLPEEWDGEPIPGDRISVDCTGNVGVGDILASWDCYVDAVIFSAKAPGQWHDLIGTQRFLNTRTEMHWAARRGLQEGVFMIDRDLFPQSWREATWTRFERTADSKGPLIKLEPKDKVKLRHHGKSPDEFDADVLAMRETTSANQHFGGMGERLAHPGDLSVQPVLGNRLRKSKLQGGRKIM